jgi:hypothetical protein
MNRYVLFFAVAPLPSASVSEQWRREVNVHVRERTDDTASVESSTAEDGRGKEEERRQGRGLAALERKPERVLKYTVLWWRAMIPTLTSSSKGE